MARQKRARRARGRDERSQPRARPLVGRTAKTRPSTQRRVTEAIRLMRQGVSLTRAARSTHISPSTVRRVAASTLTKGSRGRYEVRPSDRLTRLVHLPTEDGRAEVSVRGSRQATIVAKYWNAVHKHLATGDSRDLLQFDGVTLTDARGKRVRLLTDRAALDRLGNAGVLSFESIYART